MPYIIRVSGVEPGVTQPVTIDAELDPDQLQRFETVVDAHPRLTMADAMQEALRVGIQHVIDHPPLGDARN
jgi:hypothetical protein